MRISGALERVGLSFDDLRRLRAIGRRDDGSKTSDEGLTRSELAEAMDESASQALRAVRPLEKLGWVERSESGTFVLTESGAFLIDQAEGLAEAAAQKWFADTSTDPAQVTTALGGLRSHRIATS
ncbi:winged helix DNA-binding protein [Brevibacterium aurantiacum]|uniref:Winged helix DNA-binding protein n=1 Tax=Brevibacterium aurantiacum TaxID=273384 RepID=A0A556CDJ4_BREAU|nr:winged helix DNA-binding protein [Brevibacterium aurantiacum]TSI15527.1 winged helix DNA-binding protein [Brevibacterium aurantiacum]